MRVVFILLLNLYFLQAGTMEWVAYKETLFVGEPIILIQKFKNNEDETVKILEFKATPSRNRFYLIFEVDTHKYFRGRFAKYPPYKPDTLPIKPRDSVYSPVLLFWKDFGGKVMNPPPLPKQGDKCKILINMTDSVFLFFINPQNNEKEIYDVLKDYHFAMSYGERIDKFRVRLKKMLNNKDYLSPYLYYINKRWESGHLSISDKITMVNEMKRLFPKHILTEMAEVGLMYNLHTDDDPKNKKKGHEMVDELGKKYPSNIVVRGYLERSERKME